MARELDRCRLVERSLNKRFRKELWTPFMKAVRDYRLIDPGDRIAVCISGGKDSMLLAKLMQELRRHTEVPFEPVYLVMDPGYSAENRRRIEENAAMLRVPVQIFESTIFDAAFRAERNPCYLCARMRRGALYSRAQALGCNKIALGHHLDDVIETLLISELYGAQIQAMRPKLRSRNFPGMELIRPLYCVEESDILAWCRYNDLRFLRCACRFTEAAALDEGASKRQEVKALIARLQKTNPDVKKSLFASVHAACLDTLPGWKADGIAHSFLELREE